MDTDCLFSESNETYFFARLLLREIFEFIFMLIINVPFGIITPFLLANFLSTSLKKRNRRFFFLREGIQSLQGNGLNFLALK